MRRLGWAAAVIVICAAFAVRADDKPAATLQLAFVPTDRVQMAVWVERADGTFMGTLALTHATSTLGIGNRPGALQMNSGFRWPYGRREGVLPVWAHRRAAAAGAKKWKRVVFQSRIEGFASRTTNDMSTDDYYCLSFSESTTSREALDAVTCASIFNSDKGRFIKSGDIANGYAEPFEGTPGPMRSLDASSLYPPRRDITRCTSPGCYDHEDVAAYRKHALDVMPELDAITRATPLGRRLVKWSFQLPGDWPADDDYVLYAEVNVEGDYNDTFNDRSYPTPSGPSDMCRLAPSDTLGSCWDSWALRYGYPYRGQPSVVYRIPFRVDQTKAESTAAPVGFGDLHGLDGELHDMDLSISDDPARAQGSGADRLLLSNGIRASVQVLQLDPCAREDAPEECGVSCNDDPRVCGELLCDPSSMTCKAYCVVTEPPGAVTKLQVSKYPDERRAHMWANLSFRVPESERPIGGFDIRLKAEGAEWDQAFMRDPDQELLPVALDICADPDDPGANRCAGIQAGQQLDAVLANLRPSTHYTVEVAARDEKCNESGPAVLAEFNTPARKFTTVSPCFVATATYGSPLAREIGVLRELRDRYLATHAPGRALIGLYYRVGPLLAHEVTQHPWLRTVSRAILAPIVSLAAWWMH